MERYKLEIVNNDGDRYVRGEPAPDGSWMMFKDVEARIAELEAALAIARRAKLVVGVDPAKFGSDSTVIAVHRAGEAPRDVTTDGLLKLVDKLERAHKAQAEIAWQHYQRAEQAEARVDALETAMADVLRFVSRGDWNSLHPATRAAIREGKQ